MCLRTFDPQWIASRDEGRLGLMSFECLSSVSGVGCVVMYIHSCDGIKRDDEWIHVMHINDVQVDVSPPLLFIFEANSHRQWDFVYSDVSFCFSFACALLEDSSHSFTRRPSASVSFVVQSKHK